MDFNNQEETQKHFFTYLTKRWGVEHVLDGTMIALNILKAAAYKRMNGTTALTSHEMVVLSRHFNFSMDTIFQPNKYYAFEQPFNQTTSAGQFLNQFIDFLKPLATLGENTQLTYLASDLPLYYYFSRPRIFNFIVSVWTHEHDSSKNLLIEEHEIPTTQSNKDLIPKFFGDYPITEIWSYNMLNNLYQQILFAISVNAFKEVNNIHQLLEDINDLFAFLRNAANNQIQSQSSAKKIYINEFCTYNNTVLFESPFINNTLVSYDFPKFIVTWNPDFHNYTKSWIQKIIQRSVPISSEGYRQKEIFFKKMEKDFKQFEDSVKRAVEMYY